MIKSYQDLVSSKVKLDKAQKIFQDKLKEFYPALMNEDTNEFLKKGGEELEFLLSSCVKNKSGRIALPYKSSYSSELILTRKSPGLKIPYSHWTYFSLSEAKSWDPDSLEMRFESERENLSLKPLKEHSLIEQERFEKFIQYMTRLCELRKLVEAEGLVSYVNYDKAQAEIEFHRIYLENIGFEIRYFFQEGETKGTGDEDYHSFRSEHLFQYPDSDYSSGLPCLKIQLALAKKYSAFHEKLLELDKIKAGVMDKLKKLFNDLREENKALRVLEKLQK